MLATCAFFYHNGLGDLLSEDRNFKKKIYIVIDFFGHYVKQINLKHFVTMYLLCQVPIFQ